MNDKVVQIIITAILTGSISAISTLSALNVHIDYLKERVLEIRETSDELERRIAKLEGVQG